MNTRLFFLALAVLVSWQPASTQWVQLGPAGGTNVLSVFSAGPDLYAATGGGLYQSGDDGATWTPVGAQLPNDIWDLSANASSMFVLTGDALFRSTNMGLTWIGSTSGIPDTLFGAATNIYQLPVGENLLLISLKNQMYRSTDNGDHWTSANTGLSTLRRYDSFTGLVKLGNSVFAGNSFRGVFRSTDSGGSWLQANNGLQDTAVDAIMRTEKALFVATSGKGVFRSADTGTSWVSTSSQGLPSSVYALCMTSGHEVYANSFDSLWRSTDDGDHWLNVAPVFGRSLWGSATHLFAIGERGLCRSSDHGLTWEPSYNGMIINTPCAFLEDGAWLYAAVDLHLVYRSTDRGASWESMGTVDLMVNDFALAGPNLLAGGVCSNGGIVLSTDGGFTWSRVTSGNPQVQDLEVQPPHVYATADTNVLVSTDNGETWVTRSVSSPGSHLIILFDLAVIDSSVYAVGTDSLFVSSDNGTSWDRVSGIPGALRMKAVGRTLFVGTESNGILRSIDLGTTWEFKNVGLPDSTIFDLATSGTTLFAGTMNRGIFFSQDMGESWMPFNEGMTGTLTMRLFADDTYLYAGMLRSGVWRRPLAEAVVQVPRENQLPGAFFLAQNYPNPFNPTTTIQYTVAGARGQGLGTSEVRIAIYDLLGREVATLVNARQSPGTYTVQWNAQGNASGVYFYRLTAGSFSAVRKLVLMR